jgi:hypothetical protein
MSADFSHKVHTATARYDEQVRAARTCWTNDLAGYVQLNARISAARAQYAETMHEAIEEERRKDAQERAASCSPVEVARRAFIDSFVSW